MYAVIKTGGKQYKIVAGEKLKIEQIPADIGTELTIDQVLAVGAGDTMKFGAPLVETARGGNAQGASLTAAGREVLERYRGMQAATRQAIARDVDALLALHADMSERK